jgi:hypothetical protein
MSNYLIIDGDKEISNASGDKNKVDFMDDKGKRRCTAIDFGAGVKICDVTGKPITLNYSELARLIEAFYIMKAEGNNTHSSTIYKVQKELVKEI